ncbi:hypothetical protein T12_12456 [Trichinella patagoniensis]|uniref:Uncharacterized protein n=1 Tax=Trichinella patagoniensis TaxID=990121 RepID=A0A0V0ZPD0_9BILA|nr:hypothetical protein T12_12456 [Trichinella patagoniensis]
MSWDGCVTIALYYKHPKSSSSSSSSIISSDGSTSKSSSTTTTTTTTTTTITSSSNNISSKGCPSAIAVSGYQLLSVPFSSLFSICLYRLLLLDF